MHKDGMALRDAGGGWLLQSGRLASIPGVKHAFVAGKGLMMAMPHRFSALPGGKWKKSKVLLREAERRAVASHLGLSPDGFFGMSQMHGDRVLVVKKDMVGTISMPPADAAVTGNEGVFLEIATADCVPIFLVDLAEKVVAAVHAGWRGTTKNVAAKAVSVMRLEFGCSPANIVAVIGPSIGGCCYEVDDAVVGPLSLTLESWRDFATPSDNVGRWMLDLKRCNARLLENAGVDPANIEIMDYCTSCLQHMFFSRRAAGRLEGLQINFVGIAEAPGTGSAGLDSKEVEDE